MKLLTLFLALALVVGGVFLWAQTTSPTPSTPPPMHQHMMAMHQHMQSMQDQASQMRATLEKMKANLAKITDPALKQQAQLDVDLWEAMVQHMEGMAKMMQAHHSMMGGGMGPARPMPAQPQTPEKK